MIILNDDTLIYYFTKTRTYRSKREEIEIKAHTTLWNPSWNDLIIFHGNSNLLQMLFFFWLQNRCSSPSPKLTSSQHRGKRFTFGSLILLRSWQRWRSTPPWQGRRMGGRRCTTSTTPRRGQGRGCQISAKLSRYVFNNTFCTELIIIVDLSLWSIEGNSKKWWMHKKIVKKEFSVSVCCHWNILHIYLKKTIEIVVPCGS